MKVCNRCKEYYSDAISACKSCGEQLRQCDGKKALENIKSESKGYIVKTLLYIIFAVIGHAFIEVFVREYFNN